MRRIYLICLLFLLNCQSAEEPLPLSNEKLVRILADIHLAEAALQGLVGTTKDSFAQIYYNQVYTIHDTDSQLVNESLRILQRDPIRLEKVYEAVLDTLKKLETSIPK